MSLGYPSIRPKPDGEVILTTKPGDYGVADRMISGITNQKSELMQSHPLEYSEKNWQKNQFEMDMAMLRNVQGIQAPLKIKMELLAFSKPLRLPCMTSSNIMRDSLTGALDTIEFEDFLGCGADSEQMQAVPHMFVEKQMNIL